MKGVLYNMFKKIIAATATVIMLAFATVSAQQYTPNSDGEYSVSFTASAYGEYVITIILDIINNNGQILHGEIKWQKNHL